jgi:hypothetical protein
MVVLTASQDGVPTRCIQPGDGFPVVLVHGTPTSAELSRHVQPGIGGEHWAAEDDPEEIAGAVNEVRTKLEEADAP